MAELSQTWIDTYKPHTLPQKIADPQCKGLYLIMRRSGRHAYCLDFRCQGVRHALTLGHSTHLSLAQARELATQERAKRDPNFKRSLTPQNPIDFAEFGREFLIRHARHWKPKTKKGNERIFRCHLLPHFQGLTLEQLTPEKVQVWNNTQTHHSSLSLLSCMMKKAEALGHIPAGSNPCKGLRKPRERLTGYGLTRHEIERLWQGLDSGVIPNRMITRLIRILLLSGCRTSELRTVKRCDYRAQKLYLPDSKTGAKTIHLSTLARYWFEEQLNESQGEWVFCDDLGALSRERLRKAWCACRLQVGLPHVRMHDLRHTFATLAIEHGEHVLNVGKLLGHELPETTLRYAHLATRALHQASERVSQAIARGVTS